MGKTSQKLTILVAREWLEHPKIVALKEKGHNVGGLVDSWAWPESEADLILHPAAWSWNDDMWEYLEVAMKAARAKKYPNKRKKKEAA